ncbi:MAG: LOG family protein [Myxococcales bacterium]|nr:LOG family protein [Myxococcales bacterium]
MTRRRVVAVVGSGSLPTGDPRETLAMDLGRALVDAGYRVACGGRGGVMAAAARGARSSAAASGSDVIGILPTSDAGSANPHVDIVLPTSMGPLRNGLVAHADAVVGIGGGAGTLSELALAWVLDRPVLAYRTEGWSGTVADTKLDARVRFPDLVDDRVYGVETAAEVIVLLGGLLRPP